MQKSPSLFTPPLPPPPFLLSFLSLFFVLFFFLFPLLLPLGPVYFNPGPSKALCREKKNSFERSTNNSDNKKSQSRFGNRDLHAIEAGMRESLPAPRLRVTEPFGTHSSVLSELRFGRVGTALRGPNAARCGPGDGGLEGPGAPRSAAAGREHLCAPRETPRALSPSAPPGPSCAPFPQAQAAAVRRYFCSPDPCEVK